MVSLYWPSWFGADCGTQLVDPDRNCAPKEKGRSRRWTRSAPWRVCQVVNQGDAPFVIVRRSDRKAIHRSFQGRNPHVVLSLFWNISIRASKSGLSSLSHTTISASMMADRAGRLSKLSRTAGK